MNLSPRASRPWRLARIFFEAANKVGLRASPVSLTCPHLSSTQSVSPGMLSGSPVRDAEGAGRLQGIAGVFVKLFGREIAE